jgi:predicted extracellular nuclease
MKRQHVFSMIALNLCWTLPASAAVVLSQYVEGSSYNKAIEIANTGDESVTLDDYTLAKSTNGSGTWGQTLSLAGRELVPGGVLVIANSNANSDILAVADETDDSVINFNGNDPVALLKNGQVYDVIGTMGSDYWGKDTTLVRTTLTPSASYQPAQWQSAGKDNIEGLGTLDDSAEVSAFSCTDNGETPQFTTIQAVQGDGSASPLAGTDTSYFVRGVVSAVTTGLTKGFYLQALENDENPQTSEGLFVYTGQNSSTLKPGDVVCTKGRVKEYYNLTELAVSDHQWVKTGEQAAPTATAIEILPSDGNFQQTLERYEGMLVSIPQSLNMRVTRTFSYDYDANRNNMVLAQGRINYQPNQNFPAGSDASVQQRLENQQRRLFVESDQIAPNGVIPYYPDFGRTDADQNGSTEDYIRIDDTVVGLAGVLSYSYNEFRLIATNTLTKNNFVHNAPRTTQPKVKAGGNLRIASFNVLNYFNSPFGGDENLHGDSRGASTLAEFEVQQEKIVKAIARLDADIVGLMEIENNGFGDGGAIVQLVHQLNQFIGDKNKQYTFIAVDSNHDGKTDALDSIGTDVITTGMLYRKRVLKLVKQQVIPMPSQQAPEVLDENGEVIEDGKNYQRNTLVATYRMHGFPEPLTVAVNHLKSKGSTCWEDAAPKSEGGQGGTDPDFQGSCERFRVAAAVALGNALKQIQGHKVILGDMNAYAKEDPILVLTDYSPEKYGKTIYAARDTYINGQLQYGDHGGTVSHGFGYLNALSLLHNHNWSYSYDDEVGSLDHLLISPSLRPYVVDAVDWHINAGESSLFDYSDDYKGDLPKYHDVYRASDHDPAVLELRYGGSVGVGLFTVLAGLALWRRR